MLNALHRCDGVDPDEAEQLLMHVLRSPWLLRALEVLARSGLPDAWIGAGAVRDVVWGHLHDVADPRGANDVDVPFFDASDVTPGRDLVAQRRLTRLAADLPWEATNQAAVHVWYHRYFGGAPVPALASGHDAVATWPETATCVAVRLVGRDVDVCAPYGLADLLDGVWRRNPARVSLETSTRRLQQHRQRWPKITFVPPEA